MVYTFSRNAGWLAGAFAIMGYHFQTLTRDVCETEDY